MKGTLKLILKGFVEVDRETGVTKKLPRGRAAPRRVVCPLLCITFDLASLQSQAKPRVLAGAGSQTITERAAPSRVRRVA